MQFTIRIPPVTKKNHQQILRGRDGRPYVAPSPQYQTYERDAMWFLRPAPAHPIDHPVEVTAVFYMKTRRRVDLTNLLEAIDDVLVKARILADDHSGIIVSHDGSRVKYDKENPRTEVFIREVKGRWDSCDGLPKLKGG